MKRCSICGSEIQGYGHNAEPANRNRCCDACNDTVVIPVRLGWIHLPPNHRIVKRRKGKSFLALEPEA
jgi:hypothetical protein